MTVLTRCVLGIEMGNGGIRAALVDPYGNIRACASDTPDPADPVPALGRVLRQLWDDAGVGPGQTLYTVLVSDHCQEVLSRRKGLARVAVIRLAAPAGTMIPPLTDWPADLAGALGNAAFELPGGCELDGVPIGGPADPAEVGRLVDQIRSRGLEAAAITGVFSPLHPEQELHLGTALHERLGAGFPVTLSHRLGRVGFLERENSTALNAALMHVGPRVAAESRAALERLGVAGPVYLAQNDGTIMSMEAAAHVPLLTVRCASGHGMRGAAYLAGVADCVAVLCTEAGVEVGLVQGEYPRESQRHRILAGVRVNISQPDVIDVPAVMGSDGLLAPETVERVELALDQARGRPDPVAVVAAGPRAGQLPDRLRRTARILRPAVGAYCVAVGAALAPVGGRADLAYFLGRWTREGARADAVRKAVGQAVAAGADPETTRVVRLDEAPLTYLSDYTLRVTVKVVGQPAVPGRVERTAI